MMIIEVFPSGPVETNAYLVGCPATKRAMIIDAPFDSADLILQKAADLDLHIEALLLTHSHWDHTAEAALLKQKAQIPIYVHQEDAANVFYPGSDRLPTLFPITGVQPDQFLVDGQKIALGKLSIEVIHTPGHTPGGVCFYIEQEQVLFSGDTLFRGTMGRVNFPTSRPDLMWRSLKRLATLPPQTKVYPGHGEPTTIGAEKWIAHAQDKFM
jgi:glyoxylase-like metal-dependent hydrolase (beta-lactamase superfamily II)